MKSDNKYYSLERNEILQLVDISDNRIIEFGCGFGYLGKGIKLRYPATTLHGVEINPDAESYLRETYDCFKITDIEEFDISEFKSNFNCMIYSDVLEHTRNPLELLKKHIEYLDTGGHIIISLPNIRNIRIIYQLLFNGDWNYTDAGILDSTHYKFFTRKTLLKAVEELDLTVEHIDFNYEKYTNFFNNSLSRIIKIFNKELLACQLIIKVRKK